MALIRQAKIHKTEAIRVLQSTLAHVKCFCIGRQIRSWLYTSVQIYHTISIVQVLLLVHHLQYVGRLPSQQHMVVHVARNMKHFTRPIPLPSFPTLFLYKHCVAHGDSLRDILWDQFSLISSGCVAVVCVFDLLYGTYVLVFLPLLFYRRKFRGLFTYLTNFYLASSFHADVH